jgi:hypothetical protein
MWDSTFIYTHWTPSSKKLFKNFQFACGPCALMCDPCPSMWELIVNYELINCELEVN